MERVADWFLETEARRRQRGMPSAFETWGLMQITPRVQLKGKIDRIDRQMDDRLAIYDYKTGALPSKKQVKLFDRQLMLEAAMVESGVVEGLPAAQVAEVTYIGLGSNPDERRYLLRVEDDAGETLDPATEAEKLAGLIGAFEKRERGYAARRAMESVRYDSDYDHLARYGEWDATDAPQAEDVG